MATEQPVPDVAGCDAAVHAESGRLFAVAYSIQRDVQEAEDAVQETMELAWRSWDTLLEPSRRGAWLRQICVRRALHSRRRLLPRLLLAETRSIQGHTVVDTDPEPDQGDRRPTRL